MKKLFIFLFIIFAFLGIAFLFLNPFRAPGGSKETVVLAIDSESTDVDVVGLKLQKAGLIRSPLAFDIAFGMKKGAKIDEGGYYLSKNMDTWQIIEELSKGPDLKWVLVREGVRKEQIGETLKETFGWSDTELEKWNEEYTAMKFDYVEGVYFPDTYLIPVNDSGLEIANRMIGNFNEKFEPYFDKFADKDIVWTTGLRLASLIQREAAGPSDMKLISGILWNRLLKNQRLEVDATIQYAKGKTDGKWWSRVTPQDIREINSDYNTYKKTGLPPHPIANPGIAAIEAALNPEKTDCIFYIHSDRQIYCAETYQEHLDNIEKYLR